MVTQRVTIKWLSRLLNDNLVPSDNLVGYTGNSMGYYLVT